MKTVQRGDVVGKNYKVNKVLQTVQELKEYLSNDTPNEKLGIVTKAGNLQLVGEGFLFNKKHGDGTNEEAKNEWLEALVNRGVFICVRSEDYKNEIPPQLKPSGDVYGYNSDVDYDNAVRNDRTVSMWAWILAFNLIAIIGVSISLYFTAYLPLWYFIGVFTAILVINLSLFYQLKNRI